MSSRKKDWANTSWAGTPAALYSSTIFWVNFARGFGPNTSSGLVFAAGLNTFASGVNFAFNERMSSMLSLWVSTVAPVEKRSVRQLGVPPWNCCGVVALGLEASIFPFSDLNSETVRSLVQQSAEAALVRLPAASNSAGEKGWVHLPASGVTRMLVVVCRSHSSCRQTSSPSLVK